MGNVRFGDVRFISRIVDDDEVVFFGGFDPVGQFFLAHGRAGRVGRVAEVDDVDFFLRRFGFEAVFRSAWEIDDAVVDAFFSVPFAGMAEHDVGVEVNRVYRVGYGEFQVVAEDFLDAGDIGLGAIADEDFVQIEVDAARLVVAVDDSLTEEVIALFRTVAAEGFGFAHFVDGLVHGVDDSRGQGTGDVADAEADDIRFRMCFGISFNFFCNGCKKIVAGEF